MSTAPETLTEIQAAIGKGTVRIELSVAFGAKGGMPAAQLSRQVGTPSGRSKWVKVGPLLMPPERGTRADLLELLTNLCRETEKPFKLCMACNEPLIFTFEFPGAEYHCQACGFTGGMFGSGFDANWTPELATRHAELDAAYELARAERKSAAEAPEPGHNHRPGLVRPPGDCDRCDELHAIARPALDHINGTDA